MANGINIGNYVTALYKTGKYIGEVVDINAAGSHYVVKVLAVVKHPVQGDLHNPGSVNVPLFHERKALSQFEKANIPAAYVKPYDGDIPDYTASLKKSVDALKAELETDDGEWEKKALATLEQLEQETYRF